MNIRESVNKYLEGVTSVEQLNRKVISESVGCSVYQVGRQAGDLVRAKKDYLNSLKASNKAKKSNSAKDKLSESSGFDLLIKELGKINKRLDSIESKVNKIKKDDWIDYNLNAPPRGTKIKVKITGEGIRVGYTENFDWGTYDHEHDREDVRVCNLWNDYQHDQAYSATMNIIEDKYPKSVDYDLSRSAGYNGICEDDEVYDLFNKMSSDYQNIMSSEKRKLYNSEFESFYEKHFRAPSENGYIESYKLIDDSGEKTLKEIKKVLTAIEGISKKEREL